jgi:hypothetical protein
VPYTIGFVVKGRSKVRSVEQPTALGALKLLREFQASGGAIRFIKTPDGSEINEGQLGLLASAEGSKRNASRT